MQRQPKYRFYATLLNSYEWYKESEADNAFQEFIDKINRVPFVSEAADKGTAFNSLVDSIAFSGYDALNENSTAKKEGHTMFDGFEFPTEIAMECVDYIQHGTPQVRESGFIETVLGLIEVYGEIDYVLPAMQQVDLKTTKAWELGKYCNTWQHIVYPFCVYQKTGLESTFTYLATDFKTVVKEDYLYNHSRDSERLKSVCVELAQFIEEHRALITDLKIFNLHDPNEVKQPRIIEPKIYPTKARAFKEVKETPISQPVIKYDTTKPML